MNEKDFAPVSVNIDYRYIDINKTLNTTWFYLQFSALSANNNCVL